MFPWSRTVIWAMILSGLYGFSTPRSVFAQSANEQLAEDSDRAKRLFIVSCGRCHGIEGKGGTGPRLDRPILQYAPDDEALVRIIRSGIGGTGMPGNWFLDESNARMIASHVRSLGRGKTVTLSGSPEKGEAVFEKGDCRTCHIIQGKGISLGPELTKIGLRRGPEFLRKAVQHPGRDLPLDRRGFKEFLVIRVVTEDGREVRGVRINEDTFTLQLLDVDKQHHSFRKHELRAVHKESNESLMPSYEDAFSPEDINDLIAYLASLRGE
ncbi:MAG: c-type cytochrome [Candidatus Latescibacteria bacterium]|nr:c-type cytochrome [Candidatus Latescibacterota bacterium]